MKRSPDRKPVRLNRPLNIAHTLDLCSISTPPSARLLHRNTLRQIPREIHIQPLAHGQPIRHQLQRDHVQQALQHIDRVRDLDAVRLLVGELLVARVADDDGPAAARDDLLVGVERLGEDVVAREDHDDGEGFVDQGEHAVFEFAGHDGFAVEVGDFFDLEGACKRY